MELNKCFSKADAKYVCAAEFSRITIILFNLKLTQKKLFSEMSMLQLWKYCDESRYLIKLNGLNHLMPWLQILLSTLTISHYWVVKHEISENFPQYYA
ncbi:CLUMA_CG005144, isoform A [Clunio marinus]|uniref:CLUMA_CG005144, isoform A n=1 Tax=Clunio marinus TaxID=568069 RepID=A0A1J1HVT5_9DIPT|nr:CLUMA_CG005144, isoform A [Clunio marinus]